MTPPSHGVIVLLKIDGALRGQCDSEPGGRRDARGVREARVAVRAQRRVERGLWLRARSVAVGRRVERASLGQAVPQLTSESLASRG